jgi:hypothetical protein
MFDRVASAGWRITTAPYVDSAALGALATLLHDMGAPSQLQEIGAALRSHDANRGEVHAAPADDIPVRSILEAERRQDDADAAWQALPADTRRSVTKLIISLILDHIDGERAVQREGADHDA